ncbi:hypothetical protein DL766_007951 [Monosporascus sp. MC13-8B]|uniref:Uncharacterized protein n=1 Tax=Monosporascus cannonballus TaxID=155416 RepID=A0ABY0H4Z3_9PEZI|nr:hypothetical protein DL762_006614 [Monosporascus cannonballus]RYO93455.1 hypothetical protein DL763_004358 [Monosporascus cannonballus]RYP21413.1 hypothetical protein DL766_007951 [Monosporascus sp. MC13-8B]
MTFALGRGIIADVVALTSEFYANDNAVCIATITITLHDDTKYALLGDSGQICKADWLTKCMWMDQNNGNNLTEAVIGIYFPTFGTEEVPDTDGTELCGGARAPAWDEDRGSELLRDRTHGSKKLRSRGILPGKQAGDDRIVVSPDPNHRAT